MSMMSMAIGVLFYVVLAFVFIVSFTSICYELSPYSRRDATVSLPEWERKTLYSIAGYPPLSILLLIIMAFMLPGWKDASTLHLLVWFCTGHVLISVLGAAGAWYLRRRNSKNTLYFVTDLLAGCIYAGCLIGLFFFVYKQ
ncbi:MAG: hypothetical protein H6550_13910 [Chitinophagales bacterium]|nr:hypothetical protein [Chitinophagales bacterium]